MTTLIAAALLVGGASLAVAQGPPTGGYPPVAGGAAGNPAAPGIPSVYGATTGTPSHRAARNKIQKLKAEYHQVAISKSGFTGPRFGSPVSGALF
jgi:hypothetical protein